MTRRVPSPSFDQRRAAIDMVLLHYTGMESAQAALERLASPAAKVSAHYVVEETGAVVVMVDEAHRAWHAGRACWGGVRDINSCSIGVEIVNPGHAFGYPDFPQRQIESVLALVQDIVARRSIAPARVLGHSDVAPDRKSDPGEKFPWSLFARAGLGVWVEPEPVCPEGDCDGPVLASGEKGEAVATLQAGLAQVGYDLEVSGIYDTQTRAVVRAFQRHYRPAKIDALADLSTQKTLDKLLHRLASA